MSFSLAYTPEGYPLPKDSADLYERSAFFAQIYGDDFFFTSVEGALPAKHWADDLFSVVDQATLRFCERVSWNPKAPRSTDEAVMASRASVNALREANQEVAAHLPFYHTIEKERLLDSQHFGAGVFMLVAHDFGQGEAVRAAFLQRSIAPNEWLDACGLVAEPSTAAKECAEEYSPVLLNAANEATLCAVRLAHDDPFYEGRDLGALKAKQEAKILSNLKAAHIEPALIGYEVAQLEPFSLGEGGLTLIAPDGHEVDRKQGLVGFDHLNHSWFYRDAGLWRVPGNDRLILSDGEYDRKGSFFTRAGLAYLIQSHKLALPSTCAAASVALACWPKVPEPRPWHRQNRSLGLSLA